jgi:integrase
VLFRRPALGELSGAEQRIVGARSKKLASSGCSTTRFGFHNLRHSLASFLRTDPKTVQTPFRHSDVKPTLQFYTHAVSRDRMVAAGKMLTTILSHAPDKNGLTAD